MLDGSNDKALGYRKRIYKYKNATWSRSLRFSRSVHARWRYASFSKQRQDDTGMGSRQRVLCENIFGTFRLGQRGYSVGRWEMAIELFERPGEMSCLEEKRRC